jgi:hypothetical protein
VTAYLELAGYLLIAVAVLGGAKAAGGPWAKGLTSILRYRVTVDSEGIEVGVHELEHEMTVLSHVDPTAEVACTLPIREAGERLNAFGDLVGDRLEDVSRSGDRLRIRIRRDGDAELEAKASAWAIEEKGCCAFLGFETESEPDRVTLDIIAPDGAGATLEGIEWIARTAGRPA